jgi:hypothetical protein
MTVTLTPRAEARLQALAEQRGQAPETVIETARDALHEQGDLPSPEPPSIDEAEQARMRQAMTDILADAQTLVIEPADSQARTHYRDSAFGEILTEKYRRQGFNL